MSAFHGAFVWYELMTQGAPAAQDFYQKVVGWNARDAGMSGQPYTMLSVGEHAVGGLMELPPEARAMGARPSWIGYIAVDDVDAYAQRILKAGGKVYREPADIPGVGRFAVVTDPQGAVFNLFRGASDEVPPAPAPGTAGTIGWHELYAADWESAFAFYAELFGWTKGDAMDMGAMGTYQLFHRGDTAIGGMMTKTADIPAPMWSYYVNVNHIEAAVTRITGSGGKILMGPHQVPGGSWIVQGLDPQGAMFALVGPTL